jgi:PhoH-like ATPase
MPKMRKIVFDTSALMRDHTLLFKFPAENIVIPLRVVDELDNAKKYFDEAGWNARQAIKTIDELNIHVFFSEKQKDEDSDAAIIRTTKEIEDHFTTSAQIITEDYGMMIRARAIGLLANKIEDLLPSVKDIKSCLTFDVNEEITKKLFDNGWIPPSMLEEHEKTILDLPVWGAILLRSTTSHAIAVFNGENLVPCKTSAHSIKPKGLEQTIALWALQKPEIPLVTITGKAGTGKSFLALSVGFDAVQRGIYDRLVVVRNFQEVGKGLGYLPGDLNEKLGPWLDSLRDTLRAIYGKEGLNYFELAQKRGQVEVVPLSYVRGRTFDRSFVMLDEAQNTTPHEIKTVVTRLGNHSKLVLLGDTQQIDLPKHGEHSCGLSHVVRKFRDHNLSMHTHLTASQRSDLAGVAAEIL